MSGADDDDEDRAHLDQLVLDQAKLSSAIASEQGDIFIIQWLSKAELALSKARPQAIRSVQSQFEESLLSLLSANQQNAAGSNAPGSSSPSTKAPPTPSNYPKPARPARHLIARCFILLFTKTESRSLFDTLQSLVRVAGDEPKSKIAPSREVRVSCLYVAGEVFGVLGQQVMSLFIEIVALSQRLFKSTSNPVILRYHALTALQKAINVAGKSLSDQTGKELLKSLRTGLGDKAGAVVRGSAECLLALSADTTFISTRGEIEGILTACFKSLETADFVTKKAVSKLAAGLLASTQAENSAPVALPAKKSGKKKKEGEADSDDDQEIQPPPAGLDGRGRTMLSLNGMLDQLSHPFLKPSTSRKSKAAILDIYASLFTMLGSDWVLSNYPSILKHLIDELANHSRGSSPRAEVLGVRTGISIILRKLIGERMLGEQGQVLAIQEISNEYLKKYPSVMPEQQPPSKYTLVLALDEVAGLLAQLGSAPPQVQDALYEPLVRCLSHPSHSVQISAAWCIRTLCFVQPTLLTGTISSVLELLNRDLTLLTGGGSNGGPQIARRANGDARALAALINVIPRRPLYTSFAISAKVLSLAIQLLKNSGNHELSVSSVEISCAWTLVGSLMSLGPNFVRLHLPQLLILWRNALPKPTTKDTAVGPSTRSDGEWGFLLHVRECTLGSVQSFLVHNSGSLLNLDTARRIVAFLSNTLAFVNGFSGQFPHLSQEQVPGAERASLSLLDREHLLRRRLFQCFTLLAGNPAMEPLQASLVNVALQNFSEPDRYVGSAAQAAIAASSGNFTSIWSVADGYAFGITSLQRDTDTFVSQEQDQGSLQSSTNLLTKPDWLNRDSIEVQLDALQRRPVLGAAEHDVLVLYGSKLTTRLPTTLEMEEIPRLSPPAATGQVDSAIELFSTLLPYQERDTQVSALEALLAYSRSSRLDKNPGRKVAIQMNACVAILGSLRVAMQGGVRAGKRPSGFNNERLSTAMRELLQDALLQGDLALRSAASEAYGRLAAVAGSHAMSSQVQFLVDQVVSNRDPDARAGCAMAFGSIYSEVGGLSAGPLTKTVVNVLMSLSNDPHPTVHYYALEALRMVVEAASLSYSPYVGSTLGMLVKLYMLDTHEPEGGSAGSVNLRAELPAHQAICRVISAVIGVLGPDLQESAKVSGLIYTLLVELSTEADDGVKVEAIKATQHFGLFAADHLENSAWISKLRVQLKSSNRPLKLASINAFYQLVQREALAMSKIGGDKLVEEFFSQLDEDPSLDGVREVITSWLRQTADLAPGGWIDLCQRIMSSVGRSGSTGATAVEPPKPQTNVLQDEEAATIDLGGDSGSNKSGVSRGSRWRTQLFALQCLHEVFVTVKKSGKVEHFSTPIGSNEPASQRRFLMSSRVTDLIKMAFTASTAANAEIRLEGLTILKDVIESFKATRDPDFDDALLLEQHQAPIAAALTPAFLADSTPEVLAAAVQICAVFVGSGVVRQVSKMGRILKQLVAALECCMEPTMEKLGDVVDLSPNASAMLKIAVFTAWAELQVASVKQDYLIEVVKPHIASLAPFWVASLREYAKIRTDPEGSGVGVAGPGPVVNASLDSQYAGLAREVVTPYYERSWFKMLHAVAVLMNANHPAILKAMDGEPTSTDAAPATNSAPPIFRSEPTLFFFVLYGLAFEALASMAGKEGALESQIMRIALQAMRSLSKAQYAGTALLQDSIFEELCNLAYRLVMTEPPAVQMSVIEMMSGFAASYGKRLLGDVEEKAGSKALPKGSKLTHCLRVVICVLSQTRSSRGTPEEKAALLRSAYTSFMGIVSLYPASLQEELWAVGFYTYSEMLKDESSDVDLVGPTLSSLKELCERASKSTAPYSDLLQRSVHGFVSAALQNVDDMRTRAGSVADSKTKNSLLATVVLLTSLPASVKISQAVAEHACFLIVQKMSAEEDDVSMTAVNCARSLILASSRGNPALQYCVGQLLPGLVEFLIKNGPEAVKHQQQRDSGSVKVEEIVRTFTALFNIIPTSHRARMLGIILPIFLLLVSASSSSSAHLANQHGQNQGTIQNLVVSQLVSIATSDPTSMKEATSNLDPERKSLLETCIRSALVASQRGGMNALAGARGNLAKSENSIALKSFGA
ncbi:hypothetical protein IE53DRAFT_199598 [Violaceomyces palustris]|uniref:Uncharacterized protein n=1 Tax=Violaceomyces palustris TaxID=1673888 RepID=A0ACD0P5E6_9BASI|nr:hypothetical protein IE53DRAFT_199598 [Violaceomyces palustris]